MDSSVRNAMNTLLNSDLFFQLERELRDEDVFHILGVASREVHQSRLLAWLLNPSAGHGLGVSSLRSLCFRALSVSQEQTAPNGLRPLDQVLLAQCDLEDVLVEAEYEPVIGDEPTDGDQPGRFDALAYFLGESGQELLPLLLVEYKVGAGEGDGQTDRYAAWANANPLKIAGEQYQPLLVYITPDDSPPPRNGQFRHLRYSAFAGWLRDLESSPTITQRSRTLVADLGACLTRQGYFKSKHLQSGIAEVQPQLDVLQSATQKELAPFASLIGRYRGVFDRLGLTSHARIDYGSSATVLAVRDALVPRLAPASAWSPRKGEGSLGVWCTAVSRAVKEARADLPGLPLIWAEFWMSRPRAGSTALDFTFVKGKSDAPTNRLIELLAKSLREKLGSQNVVGPTVFRHTIDMPGINEPADDTTQRLEQLKPALDGAVEAAAHAAKTIVDWAQSELPGLIQQSRGEFSS